MKRRGYATFSFFPRARRNRERLKLVGGRLTEYTESTQTAVGGEEEEVVVLDETEKEAMRQREIVTTTIKATTTIHPNASSSSSYSSSSSSSSRRPPSPPNAPVTTSTSFRSISNGIGSSLTSSSASHAKLLDGAGRGGNGGNNNNNSNNSQGGASTAMDVGLMRVAGLLSRVHEEFYACYDDASGGKSGAGGGGGINGAEKCDVKAILTRLRKRVLGKSVVVCVDPSVRNAEWLAKRECSLFPSLLQRS